MPTHIQNTSGSATQIKQRYYLAIDLKSFYASVECVDRGFNPLTTNLVVADLSRTEKTICLAVSPSLKQYGIGGRARLFEVIQRVQEVNTERLHNTPKHRLTGKSAYDDDLKEHPDWAIDYFVAPPRMARYKEVSSRILNIYLQYVAKEDIHVYSVDEVFMDVTDYLDYYHKTPHELAMVIIRDVLQQTGITATAGIGTNMYLCKVAMDIMAKKTAPDADGVRIAELDEMSYRKQLWDHRPLTAFWRIGHGVAQKLYLHGIDTMGKIARCSIQNEDLLYRLFGVNAELLIDHAWGWEPCTIEQVKAYQPETNSLSSGQVLKCPYETQTARIIVQEMTDNMTLQLVDRGLVTDHVTLTIGYDAESLTRPEIRATYRGKVTTDHYGRAVPKHAHGTSHLAGHTSSERIITEAVMSLYDRIVNPSLLIRRLNLTVGHVINENHLKDKSAPVQLDFFTDHETEGLQREKLKSTQAKERRLQEARINIKKRFGKNAILKGLNFEDGATARERNEQIGGHKA